MEFTRRTAMLSLLSATAAGLAPRSAPAQEAPLQPPGSVAGVRSRFDHLTAPVMLNGQGPFPFIVDTGASVSCISESLAAGLALPQRESRSVHTVVGLRRMPTAMVEELRIGPRRHRRLHALTVPMEGVAEAGVLAVDWLKGQRMTLNFKRETLAFEASREDVGRENQVVVPARRRAGQLTMVGADVGAREVSAIIDSGSELSLCNRPLLQVLEGRRRFSAERRRIDLQTIMGEPFSGELVHLPFLRLGGLLLGNVPVVHADVHVFRLWEVQDKPAILLGMDVLREFQAVTLDFGRSHVRFDLRT